jgi:hypothetical protein
MAWVVLAPGAMREQFFAVLVLVIGTAIDSAMPQPECTTEPVRPALAVEPTGGVWVQCPPDDPAPDTSGARSPEPR